MQAGQNWLQSCMADMPGAAAGRDSEVCRQAGRHWESLYGVWMSAAIWATRSTGSTGFTLYVAAELVEASVRDVPIFRVGSTALDRCTDLPQRLVSKLSATASRVDNGKSVLTAID
jgi:hypothetical protein